MLTSEFKKILEDRFEAWELVDLLQVSTEEVVEAFEEVILEKLDEVKDFIDYEDEEDEY
jgi:inosine/xanthosine triphosphate pyrophosphatase family protein